MARNLEAINQMRIDSGLAPLANLPGDVTPPVNGAVEPPINENKPTIDDTPVKEAGELEDGVLLEALKKRGVNVENLDDLLPKVDADQVAEQREANKLSYGLNKGLFTKREYENFVTDSSAPQQLVYAQYHAEAKKDDPTLTDEQIQDEFEEKYGLNAEPGSRKFTRGIREITLLADKMLKDKYGKIYAADDSFSNYERDLNTKAQTEKKILQKAPAYKSDVDAIFKDLKKIKVSFGEEDYEVQIPDESLAALKELFLDTNYSASTIAKGWTKDQLYEVALATIHRQELAHIAHEASKQYHLKHQKGTKGMLPAERGARRDGGRVLTDDQKRVLQDAGIDESQLAGAN